MQTPQKLAQPRVKYKPMEHSGFGQVTAVFLINVVEEIITRTTERLFSIQSGQQNTGSVIAQLKAALYSQWPCKYHSLYCMRERSYRALEYVHTDMGVY